MLKLCKGLLENPEMLIFTQRCFSEGAYGWSLGPRPLPPDPLSEGQKAGAKLPWPILGQERVVCSPSGDEGDRLTLSHGWWMEAEGQCQAGQP